MNELIHRYVLVTTCLKEHVELPRCIFEYFEIVRVKRGQFQNFKKLRQWFIQKSPEPNMRLLFNHTKRTNTLYWNDFSTTGNYKSWVGNYKPANKYRIIVNDAMLIAINRVFHLKISLAVVLMEILMVIWNGNQRQSFFSF